MSGTQVTETSTAQTDAAVRTFLIADIRGYTRFIQEHGDEAGARLAGRFAEIAEPEIRDAGGELTELRGDELLATFSSARQALRAALRLQGRFLAETQRDPGLPIAAGIGLDAGEAVPIKGGYRGGALNLSARLCSLAGAGEVLASEGVIHLAGKVEGIEYAERGAVQLKGFADPVPVIQVVDADVANAAVLPSSDVVAAESHPPPIGGFLGALPTTMLIGREEELQRVLGVVDEVGRGSGRLLVLAGEPGVGKTRVAQEVTLAVRNRAFVLATGRCYEARSAVPYYPFLEALDTLFASAPKKIRELIPDRWPYLASLLPDRVPMPPKSVEGQEEQERLFRAVAGFLAALTEVSPVALLIDDLHWADGASLDLLQHLARNTRSHPLLLLGTYRDVELNRQHPLDRALRDLGREQLLEKLAVRRLDQESTTALMAANLDETEISDAFSDLVYHQTEGNPFFTQEVLRALIERGDLYREDGRWQRREIEEIEVPESVRSAIGERLSRLSDAAQELLREASVLGQTFSFDELQAMSQREEDEVDVGLEEAFRTGLIRTEGKDAFAFNHALTQQALYAELSPRRRRKLHSAAGRALADLPERVRETRAGELAWHFVEADELGQALPYLVLAGDQAEKVYAHQEAEDRYRSAADLARDIGDAAAEAEALEKLGGVLRTLSRHDQALEVLEPLAEMRRQSEDRQAEIRAVAQIALTHAERGSTAEGIERANRLLEALPAQQPPSAELSTLYTALARLHYFGHQGPESLKAAERGAELAREVEADRVLVQAEVRRGAALYMLGRWDEALEALTGAIALAEKLGDEESVCRALHNVSTIYFNRLELKESRRQRERMVQVAERIDDPNQILFGTGYLGILDTLLGEWERAKTELARATDIVRRHGISWYTPYVWVPVAYLRFMTGDEAGAMAALQGEQALRKDDAYLQSFIAECEIVSGRPQGAVEELGLAVEREMPIQAGWGLSAMAWAQDEMGNKEAESLAREAIGRAEKVGHALSLVDCRRILGRILGRKKRWDEAEGLFAQTLAAARSGSHVFGEARILYEWGLMLLSKGDRKQGGERLRDALKIFDRLGASLYGDKAREALRAVETEPAR